MRLTLTILILWSLCGSCAAENTPKNTKTDHPTRTKSAKTAEKNQKVSPQQQADNKTNNKTEKPSDTETDTPKTVDAILKKLNKTTGSLKSYHAQIEYLLRQDPELLDSKTLRKGELFYARDENDSKLRINLYTVKYDDEDTKNDRQDFIFDGVWLTRVDYALEKVDFVQQQREDDKIDAFEFIGENFPLVGFAKTDKLTEQFDISLIKTQKNTDPNDPIRLKLTVKDTSKYKDEYTNIDFRINRHLFLPARMTTTSTDDNIYDITLNNAKINKKIKNSVFKLETPEHFDKIRTPLE